jgi:hypothetical protein
MRYSGEKPVEPLILTVFPPRNGQSSTYTLYQDAGNTPGYKMDEAAWTTIRANSSADGADVALVISPENGRYAGMQHARSYELRLVGDWPPASVTVNGAPIGRVQKDSLPGWRYDGNTLTTIVRTPSFMTTAGVNIVIKISPELARQASLLDGFAGKMVRLRETYDILNQSWPEGWTPDEVTEAMQTGDRIGYSPATAFTELTRFAEKVAAIPKLIEDMHAIEQSPKFQAAVKANLFGQSPTHPNEDAIARFHRIVDLALAHCADLNPQ